MQSNEPFKNLQTKIGMITNEFQRNVSDMYVVPLYRDNIWARNGIDFGEHLYNQDYVVHIERTEKLMKKIDKMKREREGGGGVSMSVGINVHKKSIETFRAE